jgi:ABC-type nickel/cobalt efflux system permease component RcnA/ABC-type uncharacterized transport system substrate-binding protein
LGVNLFPVLRALAGALAVLSSLSVPALAHPHIFIDATATLVFDDSGAITAIRHQWTFDEAYSAWAVQGLDTNNDGKTSEAELQELADDNMKGLADYEFYTFAGEDNFNLKFSALPDPTINYDDARAILRFAIEPAKPYHIERALQLAINDPEYYVAISFAGPEAINLENAPAGCAARLEPPREMAPELADQLAALGPDVTELPPDLSKALRGVQGAIIITCPGGEVAPQTAIDAVSQVAQVKAPPFGGPPVEPGLNLPRTGVFGWIAEQQKSFYAALTGTLGRLKSDHTAFWLLGGLSFLYGIIHAAGPGHGKVVIGSYVLASETQFRQGIFLSFVSAMIQSLVAVLFVLVAAMVLNMTSLAMSDAAWWISIGSYAMVMLLGLWLVARKVFGWGHHHGHGRSHAPSMVRKARAHLHAGDNHHHDHDEHDHHEHHDHAEGERHHQHAHHVVTPDQIGGGWREQLGVVLAVGMRPCSGALVVLVFALSQGLLPAGIAAVFLMGLGTAIAVGVLATIAVSTKNIAPRLLGTHGATGSSVVWWLELFGAFLVLAFGALLVVASL